MTSIDSAFTVVTAEMTYEVLDRRWMSIRTHHVFKLRAEKPHRFYFREYFWDNEQGIEKPPRLLSGRKPSGRTAHRLLGPVIVGPKGSRLLVIDLGRVVEPGQTEIVEIEHFFVRVSPEDEGYVGARGQDGMEQVQLTAILPARPDLRPHFKSRNGDTDGEEWDEFEMLEGARARSRRIKIERTVTEPLAGHRYRLGWDQKVTDV